MEKAVKIIEKDTKMVNVITKLKGNEYNEMNSPIEESSTNINKEEDTYKKDNYNGLYLSCLFLLKWQWILI